MLKTLKKNISVILPETHFLGVYGFFHVNVSGLLTQVDTELGTCHKQLAFCFKHLAGTLLIISTNYIACMK